MRNRKESPCTYCCRVENPQACDNKDCMLWRKWFINRWEQLRKLYSKKEDPCGQCVCPQELCFEPCAEKQVWEKEGRA